MSTQWRVWLVPRPIAQVAVPCLPQTWNMTNSQNVQWCSAIRVFFVQNIGWTSSNWNSALGRSSCKIRATSHTDPTISTSIVDRSLPNWCRPNVLFCRRKLLFCYSTTSLLGSKLRRTGPLWNCRHVILALMPFPSRPGEPGLTYCISKNLCVFFSKYCPATWPLTFFGDNPVSVGSVVQDVLKVDIILTRRSELAHEVLEVAQVDAPLAPRCDVEHDHQSCNQLHIQHDHSFTHRTRLRNVPTSKARRRQNWRTDSIHRNFLSLQLRPSPAGADGRLSTKFLAWLFHSPTRPHLPESQPHLPWFAPWTPAARTSSCSSRSVSIRPHCRRPESKNVSLRNAHLSDDNLTIEDAEIIRVEMDLADLQLQNRSHPCVVPCQVQTTPFSSRFLGSTPPTPGVEEDYYAPPAPNRAKRNGLHNWSTDDRDACTDWCCTWLNLKLVRVESAVTKCAMFWVDILNRTDQEKYQQYLSCPFPAVPRTHFLLSDWCRVVNTLILSSRHPLLQMYSYYRPQKLIILQSPEVFCSLLTPKIWPQLMTWATRGTVPDMHRIARNLRRWVCRPLRWVLHLSVRRGRTEF